MDSVPDPELARTGPPPFLEASSGKNRCEGFHSLARVVAAHVRIPVCEKLEQYSLAHGSLNILQSSQSEHHECIKTFCMYGVWMTLKLVWLTRTKSGMHISVSLANCLTDCMMSTASAQLVRETSQPLSSTWHADVEAEPTELYCFLRMQRRCAHHQCSQMSRQHTTCPSSPGPFLLSQNMHKSCLTGQ